MAEDGQPGLPPFQLEVARMFFALPASRGFLLAGGAALLAQHLTTRPTEDLALSDRAAARDFADIYILARRFGKNVLLARAAAIDAGFDVRVLADMIATLDRFTDSEIPVPDDSSAAELRAFYAAWRSELAASAGFRRTPADPANCRPEATGALLAARSDAHGRLSRKH
jgi:hypothetical protein